MYLAITLMLGKNPLELPPGKRFTRDELAEAIRLAVIAELDAINLYVQLASASDDPLVRKVFLDVAKEEKTHVGEFLTLLKKLDPEQVKELEAGAREVEEIAGEK
ncbi:MAG: ferritin family protein [Infirmifilum sp.]